MTKNQFLERLESQLSILPYNERREILYDYEEHFNENILMGRSEEEISEALGSPYDIANKFLPDLPAVIKSKDNNEKNDNPNHTNNTDKPHPNRPVGNTPVVSVILAVTLIFINLTLVFPFYISILAIDASLIFTFFALTIVGITLLISVIFATPFLSFTIPFAFIEFPILGISGSLVLICTSGLLLIGCTYILKFIIYITIHYVKWTAKIIRGY